LLYHAAKVPSIFYYHELGVTKADYTYNQFLNRTFSIIATSVNATTVENEKAFEYIAIIEGKTLPFYGVQFHPEYAVFEQKAFGFELDFT
jgi:anthranilate/para-aminobenzoate synthase component II